MDAYVREGGGGTWKGIGGAWRPDQLLLLPLKTRTGDPALP
jgi:hypothetical protein